MNLFSLYSKHRWIFRALLPSVYFNFRKLPFSQAIKLPILVYKPKFKNIRGKFIIDAPITFGMIKLGMRKVSIYPNSGIMIENKGTIIFKGQATMGNDTYLSIGTSGIIEVGDDFIATCGLKIACYNHISLESRVLIGWNCMLCDTDFHKLTYIDGRDVKGYGPITIGEDTWIANGCKVYKNVFIPRKSVVGSDTILTSSPKCGEMSLICNDRTTVVKTIGVYMDRKCEKISY